MPDKVKLAVFDQDLIVRKYGKFELSTDGSKIRVTSGGAAHFLPKIGNTTYLDFPRRSLLPPFRKYLQRLYFVRNTASRCVDFATEEVASPDPEQVMKAAGAKIASNWGKEKTETPLLLFIILAAVLIVAAKIFEVI